MANQVEKLNTIAILDIEKVNTLTDGNIAKINTLEFTDVLTLEISSNATEYNILTAAVSAGYDNAVAQPIVVNVASGVTVSGSSTHAMRTGALNADTSLTINITGSVSGYTGANGSVDAVGAVGGDAIYWETTTSGSGTYVVNVESGGNLKSGGGGGGGRGSPGVRATFTDDGKGSGTCGTPNYSGSFGATGAPGALGASGASGSSGSFGGGSSVCIVASPGSGAAGGSAGYALRKNSRTVTLNNSGTVAGTVG